MRTEAEVKQMKRRMGEICDSDLCEGWREAIGWFLGADEIDRIKSYHP